MIVVIGYPRVESLGTETPSITEGIVSAIRPGNTSAVICHGVDNPGLEPFTGTIDDRGNIAFDVLSKSAPIMVPGGCWYNVYTGYICVGPSSRQNRMTAKWTGGFINDGLIKGDWTGILFVGVGKYPVEGTWTAIRVQ